MKKLFFVFCVALGTCNEIFAQASYMHEASEDSDGGGIWGVLSLLVFIGIGTLVSKLFSYENSETRSNGYKKYSDDEGNINLPSEYFCKGQKTETVEGQSKQKVANNSDKLAEEKQLYEQQIINMYASKTEHFGGLLIIKEDGEYHYMDSYQDKRYKILDDYIPKHFPENCTHRSIRVDWAMFRAYLKFYKNEFRPFNQLEKANVESNDFLGGKLLVIKAYYESPPCYLSVIPLDFFMSIGLEETILLHKIIKRPMSAHDWYVMQVMQNIGLKTYKEYEKYRNSAGQWHEGKDGWYDSYYGYLAPTREESQVVFEKKEGCSYADAMKTVQSIKWEYDS